ncbi:MAG TPA: 16S rRNA (guanine(966)-N(2))-methyltransferase RsmD [Clostridiales bacterium]|nr:16S rRNA (guanine(966)-N(2))-methyltransferase RsmD [Clostridiales bacterium]
MRIISGKYRGKKLAPPPQSSGIRPTTDRAKEAVFNILFDKIEGGVFLDLFSGSGAIGIEALSRGAKKVYFVDSDERSIDLIKRNLKGIEGEYRILNMDFQKAVNYLKDSGRKIDIAYCDPPYTKNMGTKIVESVANSRILNYSGVLVIERNKEFEKADSEILEHYDTRIYALSAFDFYRRQKRCAITGTFDPFTKGHLDLVNKAKELFDKVYIVILRNEKKVARYSLEKRKEIIKVALKNNFDKAVIDSYDGLTIDYCNNNDIQYILRGVRNFHDMSYEQEMAEYNYKNGGVTTLIMPARNSEISSTAVKENIDKHSDISAFVDEDIIKILKE